MKFLCRLLLLCLFGWGSVCAQNIATTINASSCDKPPYPSASARLNEEGTVQLKFLVGIDGQVIESAVEKSSGFRRLDEAARQGLSKCTFKPGTKDGVAVESWASIKYTWKLNVFDPCVGSDVSKWRSCLGTLTTPMGGLSVVEYEAGKKSGRGVEYDATGKVIRAGIFEGENLVSERNLDTKLYPFNVKLSENSANQSVNSVALPANISTSNLPACEGRMPTSWINCFGTYTTFLGNKYVGEFKDTRFNGHGTFFYLANDQFLGNKYVGEWKDSKRDGQGTLYESNGSVINQGIWADDKFVRSAQVLQANVVNQNFSLSAALPNTSLSNPPACQGSDQKKWNFCVGIEDYDSGVIRKFVGVYLNGERNGVGIEYAKDGSVLRSGTWKGFYRLVTSHAVDTQRFPFNPSVLAAVSQTSIPDTSKAERDRLAADLEASRRKQQELEEQLRASQLAVTQNSRPAQNISTERRVALVLGNATYKVNPLKNPVNDSNDMARSLRSVGFDVIEANNTTLAQMREVTRRFADKLGNSDVGLVYYSGHGVEVKGKNYLIPVNADIKREYEVVDQAFDASQFLEMMDNIRGPNNKRVNILIVDACRNNELQKSWRTTNNGLARMDAPGGTFISFATAPGRVAADGTGRNSPYTKHLLQALKQPNVPIEQVFKVVRRNVMEETKGEQIPWENSSLVGDFYFTVQR